MNRDGIEHGLDRGRAAHRALLWLWVGDPLENFEDVPVGALVFIRGHEM